MANKNNLNLHKSILITGVSGYLGSRLSKHLISKDYKVIGLIRKTTQLSRLTNFSHKMNLVTLNDNAHDNVNILKSVFENNLIETVIHCATSYGRKGESYDEIRYANYFFPKDILDIGKSRSLKSFINTHTLLDRNTNSYSKTKYELWDYLKKSHQYLKIYNMALEHFYGPGDDSSKFVSWLIKNFLENTKTLPLTLGEQKRDFIYIDDVIEAYMAVLNHDKTISPKSYTDDYEIGTGKLTTIKECVLLIHKLCGAPSTLLDFGKIPYRSDEKMEFKVNLQSIKSLGWSAKTPLETGLKATIDFERKNRT